MVLCRICRRSVAKNGTEVCKCSDCGGNYHKNCVNVNPAIEVGNAWICSTCDTTDNPSDTAANSGAPGGAGSQGPEFKQVLSEINTKISIMYTMKKDLETLTQSTEFLSNKYDELVKMHLELLKKLKNNENKLTEVINKNTFLEKYNQSLEYRIQELEQIDKNCNIELYGIDHNHEENVEKIVEKIASKLNTKTENIEKIWRLPKRKDTKPSNVIIRFTRQTFRDEWLKRKKIVLTNNDIFSNGNSNRIYINENLTKEKKELLYNTKKNLKSKFKYIWIQNGKILIRGEGEGNKIIHIKNENDINKYV